MITMTKKSVLLWDTPVPRNEAISFARDEKLASMVDEGKMDGFYYEINSQSGCRYFVNEAAAQEYIDFMVALAAENGRSVTGTISDIGEYSQEYIDYVAAITSN